MPDHGRTIDERTALAAALAQLTRRERTIVVLRYYVDLSEAEVAAHVGVSVGTVKSTSSKALAKLRRSPSLSDTDLSDIRRAGVFAGAGGDLMSENNFGEELGKLPPDLTLGATSEQIIRRGRRIRTFRQTSIVGAAAVAVLGITSVAALASGGHHGAQTVQSGSGNGLGIGLAPPASPTFFVGSWAPTISVGSGSAAAIPEVSSSAPASPTFYFKSSPPTAVSSAAGQLIGVRLVHRLTRAAVDAGCSGREPRRQRAAVGQRGVGRQGHRDDYIPCSVRNPH